MTKKELKNLSIGDYVECGGGFGSITIAETEGDKIINRRIGIEKGESFSGYITHIDRNKDFIIVSNNKIKNACIAYDFIKTIKRGEREVEVEHREYMKKAKEMKRLLDRL